MAPFRDSGSAPAHRCPRCNAVLGPAEEHSEEKECIAALVAHNIQLSAKLAQIERPRGPIRPPIQRGIDKGVLPIYLRRRL